MYDASCSDAVLLVDPVLADHCSIGNDATELVSNALSRRVAEIGRHGPTPLDAQREHTGGSNHYEFLRQ
jgi:hypothetical protein